MSNTVAEAKEARAKYADRMEAYFKEHPLKWIHIVRLARLGSFGWSSRIRNELRRDRKLNIEWNHRPNRSAYRFLPYVPLARDAGTHVPQRSLF